MHGGDSGGLEVVSGVGVGEVLGDGGDGVQDAARGHGAPAVKRARIARWWSSVNRSLLAMMLMVVSGR